MFTVTKPLLLLDVDGVLIPYAAPEQPIGFLPYMLPGEWVWLSPRHGEWLRPLHDQFQLVWATGWEHHANHLIGPILGLPPLPVIEFPRDEAGRFAKFLTITSTSSSICPSKDSCKEHCPSQHTSSTSAAKRASHDGGV